ncbi:hypothetical protein, partial [Streptomyces sp. NPDC058583]|uniref:hypothetical protein n=1 Tax=Streptomyces sp. NPDC058583 TaxID=3346549 RepID=UPI0036654CED
MVEALVVQSRTARLPEADIAVWRDRIAEAFARGSEGGAELREAGRAWQKQIDEAAGLMGAGPDELLDNVSEGSLTPQESLARAAEEAGMAKADLVEWVREIRDAWGQGRNDDAAELVDAFWNTIEEVSAQTAAEQAQARQAELMERMAGLKDMTLEEYTAFKTRQDTAEQTLKDQLRTLTDDTPAGPGVLRESLRQAVENMPADATGTLLAAELRDLLAASPDSVAEQTLREDLSALLRDTPDMPEGPAEGLARLESLFDQTLTELRLEQLDALPDTPAGDSAIVEVWARLMQDVMEVYSARYDMPEGEVAYWQEKYRQAGENGFDRTVLADVT